MIDLLWIHSDSNPCQEFWGIICSFCSNFNLSEHFLGDAVNIGGYKNTPESENLPSHLYPLFNNKFFMTLF